MNLQMEGEKLGNSNGPSNGVQRKNYGFLETTIGFSTAEMSSLTALCNTLFPSLPLEARGLLLDDSDYSKDVEEFYRASLPKGWGTLEVAETMKNVLKPEALKIVKTILWLLSTSLGTFLLAGRQSLSTKFPFVQRYGDLPTAKRERVLLDWSTSSLSFFRAIFKAVKGSLMWNHFTRVDERGHNPFWKAIQYCGPDPVATAAQLSPKPLESSVIDVSILHDDELDSALESHGCKLSKAWDIASLANVHCSSKDHAIECDVVIVGSGSGGGVAAAVLAKAGLKVVVLEKGAYMARHDLSLLEGNSVRAMYEERGLLRTEDQNIVIFAGSTVGGGSAVNWSASFRTPDHVLREWNESLGLRLFGSCRYSEAMDRVCERLGVQEDFEVESLQNAVLRKGCQALGYHVGNIPRNAPADHYCGWCHFGCRRGVKQATSETWLVDAANGGAVILSRCPAHRILHTPNGSGRLDSGSSKPRKAIGVVAKIGNTDRQLFIKARATIAASGALRTPPLLRSSGLKNHHIGRNLHLHPVQIVWGYFPPGVGPDGNCYQGGIMTAFSNEAAAWKKSGYGALLQTPILHPGTYATMMPWRSGSHFKETMVKFSRTSSLIVLVRDKGSGTVSAKADGSLSVRYKIRTDDEERARAAVEKGLRVLAAAGAVEVGSHHPDIDSFKVDRGSDDDFEEYVSSVSKKGGAPLYCAHQMGSCSMELQADLRLLPKLILEVLPTLNTGNSFLDRNFYRVLKLMCKALEEARDTLDEYMISVVVSLLQTRSFNLRLEESRNRIKHAVSLYNTYCNEGTPFCINPVMPTTRISMVDKDLMNMWECVNELDQDKIGFEPMQGPCPKKILRAVAKLRAKKVGTDEVQKWGEEEMEQFYRAGGLEALASLLCSSNSHHVQMQALKFLGNIVTKNESMKKMIIHDNNTSVVELIGSVMALSSGDLLHESVAFMRTLLRNNGENVDVKKACQPAAMASLLRILACSSCNVQVQENVLGLLWEFSAFGELNWRIANSIDNDELVFERLVQLCGCCSSSPVLEFCAAALLQNLCMNEDMRGKFLSAAGVSEGLLYLIESSDMHARIQVLKRVESSNSPMVMGWSISMLDCGFETHQIRGLDLLLGFSESQSLFLLQLGAHEGAISRLVKLLNSGSTTVLEKATEVLHLLSMPEENEIRIVSHDMAIQRLTELLESDSSTVRGNAVKVLESLSFNAINKEKILEQNRSVEKVAALLFHESFAAQSSACSLLWNLSNTTIENKIRITSIYGVPQMLSDLLLSESALVQEKAAGAIMSLSYTGRSRKMIASIACTFERLIKLLESVSTLVHQNAAGALYNLSISPQNIAAIGAHPRAVVNLVSLLSSKCGLVQEYAAGALGNLTLFEEIREDMKQMGAMPLLKKIKNSSSNLSVKTQAKRALANLMV